MQILFSVSICVLLKDFVRNLLSIFTKFCTRFGNVIGSKFAVSETKIKQIFNFRVVRRF